MKFAITCTVLVCLAIGAQAASMIDEQLEQEWSKFKETYNKQYRSVAEEEFRKQIFADNLKIINEHNSLKYGRGLSTYRLGVNNFADQTNPEFRRHMNGVIVSPSVHSASVETFTDNNVNDLPDEVDWTKKGVVAPIKNQGQCGSCWAFSAVASMEGQHAMKTGNLVTLSEQNLVDCSQLEGDNGCEGGWMDHAFEFVIKNNGIDTENSYPYVAVDETCREKMSNKTIGATIKSYKDVKSQDEHALRVATAKIGPISVAIDASSPNFQLYESGVYDHDDCSQTLLDHGVAVVGYGTLDGKKYWKVRNSWGTSWGMKGYILMSRDADNQCGIATKASFPIV